MRSSSWRAATVSRAGPGLSVTLKRWRSPTPPSQLRSGGRTPSSAATPERLPSCSTIIPSSCGRVPLGNTVRRCFTTCRANGVEDFCQKTPKNILDIAKLLLNAGAEVNAESDAYGGRSTTLGLTATSRHPEHAGVQLPLMDLLIDHGAVIDGPDGGSAVNGCLHNGRGAAAEFLASRGARLDLEGAAGVGRLDVVTGFFTDEGRLKPTATEQQAKDGFAWACEFGRTSVVECLLGNGRCIVATRRPRRREGRELRRNPVGVGALRVGERGGT